MGNVFKKIVVCVLVAALLVSGLTFGTDSYAAEQTITIYASKVKTEKSSDYVYDEQSNSLKVDAEKDVVLVMDSDLDLNSMNVRSCIDTATYFGYGNFTIKGSGKLRISEGSISVYANYYQESGTNIEITNGRLWVQKNANFASDSVIKVTHNKSFGETAALFVEGELYTAGNISVSAKNSFGVFARDKAVITGGVINSCTDYVYALSAYVGTLTITGGEIYCEAMTNALAADSDITVSGGYVDVKSTKESDPYTFYATNADISIVEPMYIKEPVNGHCSRQDSGSSYYTNIVDENGNQVTHVIIGNKAAEQKVAEEAAAKKAAEEAAAKKAAEEAPAKKAAEEAAAKKAAEEAAAKKAAEEAAVKKSNDSAASSSSEENSSNKYCNEWVDGRWYNSEGVCDYEGILTWKCNSTGWWVEDTLGWYPVSQWQKINGKWYYFTANGYMDYSEYRDGYWLGSDGAWVEEYYGGHWCSDSKGWWYEDSSGWYPQSQYLWIDGVNYYFGSDGYMQ